MQVIAQTVLNRSPISMSKLDIIHSVGMAMDSVVSHVIPGSLGNMSLCAHKISESKACFHVLYFPVALQLARLGLRLCATSSQDILSRTKPGHSIVCSGSDERRYLINSSKRRMRVVRGLETAVCPQGLPSRFIAAAARHCNKDDKRSSCPGRCA